MFLFNIRIPFFCNFTWDRLRYKYKSRFVSIVVPYVIWCTLYYMYYVIVTHIPFIVQLMNGDMVVALDLRIWFSWLWVDSYYVFWFLKSLMIMILLAPVIFLALKNRGRFLIGIIILVLSAIASRFITWWPFETSYLLGAYVGINHNQCALKCNKKLTMIAWIGVVLWIVTTVVYTFGIILWRIPTEIVLVCIWYAGDCFKYDHIPKWWVHISFFIYCLHDMILEIYEKIILKLFGTSPIMALTDYIVAPILTVLTIVGIAAWMKHYTPRVWKILTGGRG